MKYYSESLKKIFNSEDELKEAEKQEEEKLAEKKKLAETRKARAAEIEEAYKKTVEAREAAKNIIAEADKKYNELVDKFVQDFGSYHETTTTVSSDKDTVDVIDSIFNVFHNFPIFLF